MGRLEAICMSARRGTVKRPVSSARLIENHGIEGDAHAGNWHRQVSMLAAEDIEDFNRRGGGVSDGDFGENLVISGMDFGRLAVGAVLRIGAAELKITQRGKECHNDCEIKKRVGMCIMPLRGIFAEVVRGGEIHIGDTVQFCEKK